MSSNQQGPAVPTEGSMQLSRRSLLQKGAGLAALGLVPGVLAACGGSGSSSSSTSGGATTAGKIGGTVGFIGYEGTDFLKVLKSFYASNGITIEASYVGTMSEIPPKFAAGGGEGIDLISYTAPGNQRLQESGVAFQALDLERIPNWKYMEEFIALTGAENYSNPDGDFVAVPWAWGGTGINYDSSAIPEPKSWEELKGPAFKGKLIVIDDPSVNYDVTAEILGFKSNEMTQDQFDKVNQYLREILANVKKISPTYGDLTNLLASGEVSAAYSGWSAINTFAAEAGNPNIKTNLEPEEGGGLFVEQYALAGDAPNPDTAYAIMNHICDPKVNAEVAASVVCASTAKGSQKFLPKPVASLYKPESEYRSYFGKQAVAVDPPAQSDKFVTFAEISEAWTELKTGA